MNISVLISQRGGHLSGHFRSGATLRGIGLVKPHAGYYVKRDFLKYS